MRPSPETGTMGKTLLSLIRDGLDVLRQSIRIRRGDSPAIPRDELLRAYVRVESGYLQSKYFGTKQKPPVEILGYRFDFTDYQNFRFLFHEIFLSQDYHFITENEEPYILDCGSNIGSSILYFKKIFPRARIIGFEPFDHAFQVLKRNIDVNHLQDVTVHKLALSDRKGSNRLFYDPSNPGSSVRGLNPEYAEDAASVAVETTTLSGYIDRTVDFLKMDIEGSEIAVMQELHDAKKLPLIQKAAIEYHHHVAKDVDCLSQLLHILEQNHFGYQVHSVLGHPRWRGQVQGIMIYAYRK
jgi:FkbM family methyltransferase